MKIREGATLREQRVSNCISKMAERRVLARLDHSRVVVITVRMCRKIPLERCGSLDIFFDLVKPHHRGDTDNAAVVGV